MSKVAEDTILDWLANDAVEAADITMRENDMPRLVETMPVTVMMYCPRHVRVNCIVVEHNIGRANLVYLVRAYRKIYNPRFIVVLEKLLADIDGARKHVGLCSVHLLGQRPVDLLLSSATGRVGDLCLVDDEFEIVRTGIDRNYFGDLIPREATKAIDEIVGKRPMPTVAPKEGTEDDWAVYVETVARVVQQRSAA